MADVTEGNEKPGVWSAPDCAEEEMKAEVFCIRFGNVERPPSSRRSSWRRRR